jgi:SET and MYND domain-containing protein
MKLRRMRQTRFVLFSCTGAEVLAQEPYVAVLDGNSQHKRCDRCFSLSSNLKRCSACKSVFYCCILCQKKEWLLHKYECQATVKLFKEKQRTLTSSLRLMLRLWIKRRLQAEGVSECIYIATSSSSLILLYLVF